MGALTARSAVGCRGVIPPPALFARSTPVGFIGFMGVMPGYAAFTSGAPFAFVGGVASASGCGLHANSVASSGEALIGAELAFPALHGMPNFSHCASQFFS